VSEIQLSLQRKIAFKGEVLSFLGSRLRFDQYFISILHRVEYTGREYLASLLDETLTEGLSHDIVSSVGEIPVTKTMIQQFKPDIIVDSIIVRVVVELLKLRELRIIACHSDVNKDKENYVALKQSVFLMNDFFSLLMDNPKNPLLKDFFPSKIFDINSLHQFFLLFPHPTEVNNWIIVVVCASQKKIYYINPKYCNNLLTVPFLR